MGKAMERGRSGFETRVDILSKVLNDRDELLGSRYSGAEMRLGHRYFMARHTYLMRQGSEYQLALPVI